MVDLSIVFYSWGPSVKAWWDQRAEVTRANRGWPGKYPTLVLNNRGIICELEKY